MSNNLCPCGSSKNYIDCCKIAYNNIKEVTTAEALMRSRYSAFAKANIDYLLRSWSSRTRNNSKRFKKELLDWTTTVNWLKLEIISTTKGQITDETGTVYFKAFYYENSQLEYITENSFFEKENGHWVYVNAL